MRIAILTLLAAITLSSCDQKSAKNIVKSDDYQKYLDLKDNKKLESIQKELQFWEDKFKKAPSQLPYLSIIASNNTQLFDRTGKIEYLYKADSLLVVLNKFYNQQITGTLRSLARNYISQHRFKEALGLAQKAKALGDGLDETNKLLFDVNLELGNYQEAEKSLAALPDTKGFDYLIRIAKWNDHLGDINRAVSFMKDAAKVAEKEDNESLKIWAYTNLGDISGHAGNIEESYSYYLKTLQIDPNNTYALKGLAWINFSHEKNTKEAKRIIAKIQERHDTADYYLLLAEIAKFEDNKSEIKKNLDTYFNFLKSKDYGAMYTKYNVLIYAEDAKKVDEAIALSKIEIAHRPTPDSYDLLAWSLFKKGKIKEALAIEETHIIGKSFEPKLIYHLAKILKANNKTEKISKMKEDLESNIFELGPNFKSKISSL
jgi:hypothetical protein